MLALRSHIVFGYLNTPVRISKHLSLQMKNSTELWKILFTVYYVLVNINVYDAIPKGFFPGRSIPPTLFLNCIVSVISFPEGKDSDHPSYLQLLAQRLWATSLGKDYPGYRSRHSNAFSLKTFHSVIVLIFQHASRVNYNKFWLARFLPISEDQYLCALYPITCLELCKEARALLGKITTH